jgi:hypothetical protein
MRSETIAIDCDLRRLHAWGTGCGRVCYNASLAQAIKHLQARRAAVTDLVVLFEIASPIVYGSAQEARERAYNTMRWAIYNAFAAGRIAAVFPGLLVAPSSAWTESHSEKQRHAMAATTASNHDLRECQAMLSFYRRNPVKWVPYHAYLEKL